jgi:hypothetical protein
MARSDPLQTVPAQIAGVCCTVAVIDCSGTDAHEWRQRLRVVRQLPLRAELSKPGEAWGQVLDKPPGRKPRGRADTDQQSRGSMGI